MEPRKELLVYLKNVFGGPGVILSVRIILAQIDDQDLGLVHHITTPH